MFSPGRIRRTRRGAVQLEQREGSLDEPGGVPASDDGLLMRVTHLMVVGASLSTGIGIIPRPATFIDRIPGGRCLQRMGGHHLFQARQRHCACVQGIIDAAPRALEARGQAQMNRMLDDRTGQEGIKHLGQRITTTAEGGINLLTKGAQALKGFCFHALPYAKVRLLCLFPFAFSLLLVKCQDKDSIAELRPWMHPPSSPFPEVCARCTQCSREMCAASSRAPVR